MTQAVERPLSRPFDVEILDPTGKCALDYCPQRECSILSSRDGWNISHALIYCKIDGEGHKEMGYDSERTARTEPLCQMIRIWCMTQMKSSWHSLLITVIFLL
ncbi:conserved hypothetical protein [Ricinus communis]|uniref:Uncharacterized protein n=1 Tax=Ricinus communis TaxID=3988 RepID=B9R9G1_RICCO|nr:conserved hypothetical protein [Ricinus communis]